MQKEDYEEVEQLIGYQFKQRLLLQQAFTRKSYTNETHDGENNEVLEFIGDKVLDFIVVKKLSEFYGDINDGDEFECDYNEGQLTEIKKRFTEGKMLAKRVDILGFNQYLIMGKGDRKNNVQDDESVKEDLFEAIIGAVAIDCDWNCDIMQNVVEMMLDIDFYLENGFDSEENYVDLIQQWCQKENGYLPSYEFDDYYTYVYYYRGKPIGEGSVICKLNIDNDDPFIGYGDSKSQARMNAAQSAYEYLDEEGMLYTMEDEIGEPSKERAVSQLHELAQKGYFDMPEYVFIEKHDDDGCPLWRCECHVKGYNYYYWNTASSKKEAKRKSAFNMLKSILNADGYDNSKI